MGLCDDLRSHVERLMGASTSKISLKEFTALRNPFWNQPLLPVCSSDKCCRKISSLYTQHTHTHSRTFCTAFSSVPPNLKITAKLDQALGVLSGRAAETAQYSVRAIMGGNSCMDELLQTRLFFFYVGWSFFVPSTPCEVNGLMDRPRTRGLFTLIHLSRGLYKNR